MKAPRWALALTALGTVGASALVIGLPGSASADENRYNLEARGDAFYFEVNGDEIPASPKNDAGSLTAQAETTNSGGSKGFAGSPYFGNTVQTAPGTVNGVPNQFGLGALQIPFAVLPGYVQSASNSTQEAEQDLGFGRVKSTSTETGATSSASYGAPGTIPAPNQQQNANATTESKGNSVSAAASGSSSGIVTGPLEIGNSTAIAAITQVAGKAPKIESKTFGRFSVSGQEFGFDQDGFRYLGQGMSSKDALAQANSALKAANIQLGLAPVTTEKDETGKTIYSIGGLSLTTTQTSPTGSGATYTITYILGRAFVGASIEKLGFASSGDSTDSSTDAAVDSSSTNAGTDAAASTSALDSVVSPDLAAAAAAVPTQTATITDGSVTPVTDGAAVAGASDDVVQSLGFVAPSQTRGDSTEWLYAVLILAGVGVLGGHFLFSRFAVAAKGA